jgi:hypothetical protein
VKEKNKQIAASSQRNNNPPPLNNGSSPNAQNRSESTTTTDTTKNQTGKTQANSDSSAITASDPQDTIKSGKDSLDVAVEAQIAKIHTLYDGTIAPVNSLMGLGWDYTKMNTTIKKWYFNLPYYMTPPRWKIYYFRTRYILHETAKQPRVLFGFLITALAITMGAPFWFDLLNRFVNIRAGGNKPSEDADAKPVSVSITEKVNQKPAINSFG